MSYQPSAIFNHLPFTIFILVLFPIIDKIFSQFISSVIILHAAYCMPQKGKSIEDISGGQIVLYQNNLEVKLMSDTVWFTQKQMLELFQTERSVITKHLRNILKTKELEEKAVCANFAHTAQPH